jgi:DNA-directed RNA polymerase specialized sigma24 family protein
LNPELQTYFGGKPPPRPGRRRALRPERRIRKRLDPRQIECLVAAYAAGAPSAELGRRYGIDKKSVVRLVRQAGKPVRHQRMTADETARIVELYEAGLTQKEIGERLGRSPSAVWHCLRRLGLVGRARNHSPS